jgi:excinuclease ABC subunit A
VVRGRKGEYRKELQDYQKRGFQRVKVDGTFYEIDSVPALNKKLKHDIEVVVDRIVVRDGIQSRLADSLETGLHLSEADLRQKANAPKAKGPKASVRRPEPITFSSLHLPYHLHHRRIRRASSPSTAVQRLPGLRQAGHRMFGAPEMVVPDDSVTLRKGAIAPLASSTSPYYMQTLDSLAKHYKFSTNSAFKELPERIRKIILFGSGDEPGP